MRQRDFAMVEHDDGNVLERHTGTLLLLDDQREMFALESGRLVYDYATPDHKGPQEERGRCGQARQREISPGTGLF